MKKILLFAILTFSLASQAQKSFYKGAIVVDVRTGFELYNTTLKSTSTNGSTSRDTVDTDKAADTHFGFGAEYGLHKYLGVGFAINKHKFLNEKDSATGQKADTRSTDINLAVNFHAVSSKKFDLVLGTDFGISNFHFGTNDKVNTVLTGKGMYASFYVNPRIYFGPVGINFRLFTPMFSYKNVTTNNADFNKNNTIHQLKGAAAWGVSFGIQYRFMKESGGTSSGASH
ncbi:MAG: hypothetical protein KBG47_03160 [Bacteroidia bacterium]|jgi:hypothetical protein|nr:hypothetical protein [Sphingobacteriaceae bacterium]MBK7309968.1 hypothetical protein [Sphingobacteriaceae bacterium]MBP9068478.1 hypothetical protein [Bacteroidia bacterium]